MSSSTHMVVWVCGAGQKKKKKKMRQGKSSIFLCLAAAAGCWLPLHVNSCHDDAHCLPGDLCVFAYVKRGVRVKEDHIHMLAEQNRRGRSPRGDLLACGLVVSQVVVVPTKTKDTLKSLTIRPHTHKQTPTHFSPVQPQQHRQHQHNPKSHE